MTSKQPSLATSSDSGSFQKEPRSRFLYALRKWTAFVSLVGLTVTLLPQAWWELSTFWGRFEGASWDMEHVIYVVASVFATYGVLRDRLWGRLLGMGVVLTWLIFLLSFEWWSFPYPTLQTLGILVAFIGFVSLWGRSIASDAEEPTALQGAGVGPSLLRAIVVAGFSTSAVLISSMEPVFMMAWVGRVLLCGALLLAALLILRGRVVGFLLTLCCLPAAIALAIIDGPYIVWPWPRQIACGLLACVTSAAFVVLMHPLVSLVRRRSDSTSVPPSKTRPGRLIDIALGIAGPLVTLAAFLLSFVVLTPLLVAQSFKEPPPLQRSALSRVEIDQYNELRRRWEHLSPADLREQIDRNPMSPGVLSRIEEDLVLRLWTSGRRPEAVDELRRLIVEGPPARAGERRFELASYLERLGRNQEAEAILLEIMGSEQNSSLRNAVFWRLANRRAQQDRRWEAFKFLAKYIPSGDCSGMLLAARQERLYMLFWNHFGLPVL